MRDAVSLLVGSGLGALLGYWTNYWYQRRSCPALKCHGFFWRPGVESSRYNHSFDEGDLLKFWFVLKGRSSPGLSSVEIIYTPPDSLKQDSVSVFAKWDEAANPLVEQRLEDGSFVRAFYADRVPGTYFIPLRIGRIYTVPILWGTPPAYRLKSPDVTTAQAVKRKEELLLFSGWWFDPQRPRPYFVPSVVPRGKLRLILNGEGLHWEHEVLVEDLLENCGVVERGESDARQGALLNVLPKHHAWSGKGGPVRP